MILSLSVAAATNRDELQDFDQAVPSRLFNFRTRLPATNTSVGSHLNLLWMTS
jgi:hypothetical protein